MSCHYVPIVAQPGVRFASESLPCPAMISFAAADYDRLSSNFEERAREAALQYDGVAMILARRDGHLPDAAFFRFLIIGCLGALYQHASGRARAIANDRRAHVITSAQMKDGRYDVK